MGTTEGCENGGWSGRDCVSAGQEPHRFPSMHTAIGPK